MKTLSLAAALLAATALVVPVLAQGGGRGAAEQWFVEKTKGGVYKAPMKPLWKKADLIAMHRGQNNWSEQIILDPENDVTYNSGAPGAKIDSRMHPDTPTLFIVIQGEMD